MIFYALYGIFFKEVMISVRQIGGNCMSGKLSSYTRILRPVIVTVLVLLMMLPASCLSVGTYNYRYKNSGRYSYGGARLDKRFDNIDIDWISGTVTVKAYSGNTVVISEEAGQELSPEMQVHYFADGNDLSIKFMRAGRRKITELRKDLTVMVPGYMLEQLRVTVISSDIDIEGTENETLEVSSVSGDIRLADVRSEKGCKLESVSGDITAERSAFRKIEIDTVSGNTEIISGSGAEISVNTTSGNITVKADMPADKTEIDTISGDILIYVKGDEDMAFKFESVSGSFETDVPMTASGDRMIMGRGRKTAEISSISGDLSVKAG